MKNAFKIAFTYVLAILLVLLIPSSWGEEKIEKLNSLKPGDVIWLGWGGKEAHYQVGFEKQCTALLVDTANNMVRVRIISLVWAGEEIVLKRDETPVLTAGKVTFVGKWLYFIKGPYTALFLMGGLGVIILFPVLFKKK